MAGKIGTPTSPMVVDSGTDANGKRCTLTITFNNATLALTGATLHRDAGCLYTKALIGVGGDGRPDSSPHVFNLSGIEGDVSRNAQQLSAIGLDTYNDITALGQIAFGF